MHHRTAISVHRTAHHAIRPARFAGICYPARETELSDMLDSVIFQSHHLTLSGTPVNKGAHVIIAPHIDFRVGLSAYGPAYYALSDSNADTFIILATSHYGWGSLFIPTFQHFTTPHGIVRTDTEILCALYDRLPTLSRDDTAHHEEHSIEFEVVFLQRLFGHREFTIVPILVTSFYPLIHRYHTHQHALPTHCKEFQVFVETLQRVVEDSGKNAAYVVSADMAHIGRKFDDPYDAATMLATVQQEDMYLLQAMETGKSAEYFRRIAAVRDAYKICGLPPVYSMLEIVHPANGSALAYQQWYEQPTQSAVTYSSLAYYKP
ncbi:MAG: AmmeMemoRadiSam system protein B [Bacteroidota bacterium]|nr:AmmeMemoRadiSam system protein B [Candidatus Kapabacteria bacterium]MDW8219353.1 AmmeMemoRadiSam system protein B [Bacteroidota bacterium]